MYKKVNPRVVFLMKQGNGTSIRIIYILKVDKTMLMSDNLNHYVSSAERIDRETFQVVVTEGGHSAMRRIKFGTILYKDTDGYFHFSDNPKGKLKKTNQTIIEISMKGKNGP